MTLTSFQFGWRFNPVGVSPGTDNQPAQAFESSEAIANSIFRVVNGFTETAAEAARIAEDIADIVTQWGEAATLSATQLLEQATEGAGQVMASVAENPLLQYVTKLPGVDQLPTLLGQIDIEQARAEVDQLQREHPLDSPSQIAHHIMVNTALRAGGIGLVTNIIPPIALALLAVDLAAMMKLQVEMVYRIAAAYGYSLQDPSRRGEVLAIFGLSLGGSGVLKTGLSVVEVLPGIGAVVGASSNAALLYSLGHITCQFYELKRTKSPARKD